MLLNGSTLNRERRESRPGMSETLTRRSSVAAFCWAAPTLSKFQERGFALLIETHNVGMMLPQKLRDFLRAAIPKANPDNLWRCAQKHAEPMKVLILAYEQTPVCLSKLPNCSVFRTARANLPNVQRVGKNVAEQM